MQGPAWCSPDVDRTVRWLNAARLAVAAASAIVISVGGAALSAEEQIPLHERIDRLVESAYVGPAAPLVDDAGFLRRVSLDLTGRIPTSDEVRAFLADTSADKRQQLVDRLLASAAFVRHMTDTFDVMWMERRRDQYVPSLEWRAYLFESFASGKPLHVLIREILSSDGTDPALRPAAKFFLDREADANLLTRDIGRMFFGVDLQCAQCHDHPLITSYTQPDYYGIFAFLNRTVLFIDPKDNKKVFLGEKAEGDAKYKSAFTQEEGNTLPRLPLGQEIEDPILAKEAIYVVKPEKNVRPVARYSRRLRLAEEATSGKNLAFNRNLANRLWALVFGRGLVEPVDLHHPDNPPAHAQLLDELAADLAAHQFDLRYFLRELVLSRTYQRSGVALGQWVEASRDVESRVSQFEEEAKRLEQAYQEISAQREQLQAQKQELLSQIEPVRQKWREVEQAKADADWAVARAEEGLKAAEDAVTAHQQSRAAVQEALAAAEKAAQLLAEEELKTAVAQLQTALKSAEDRLQKLQKELADRQQAAQTARDERAKLEPSYQQICAERQQAEAPLAGIVAQLAEVERRKFAAFNDWVTARRRLDDVRWLAQQRNSWQEWAEAKERHAKLQAELAQLQREQAELQQQLAAANQASSASAASASNEIAARLEQLQQKIAQQTEQLQQATQAMEEKQAAVAESFAEAEQRWIRQLALASLKPLTPEQLAWSTLQATGVLANTLPSVEEEVKKKMPDWEQQRQRFAWEVERALEAKFAGVIREYVALFGSGPAQPPQLFFATVDQALYLANSGTVLSWLAPSGQNLVARLTAMQDLDKAAEELYLAVLTRLPEPDERRWVVEALAQAGDQKTTVIRDLVWALVSSAEFRFCP